MGLRSRGDCLSARSRVSLRPFLTTEPPPTSGAALGDSLRAQGAPLLAVRSCQSHYSIPDAHRGGARIGPRPRARRPAAGTGPPVQGGPRDRPQTERDRVVGRESPRSRFQQGDGVEGDGDGLSVSPPPRAGLARRHATIPLRRPVSVSVAVAGRGSRPASGIPAGRQDRPRPGALGAEHGPAGCRCGPGARGPCRRSAPARRGTPLGQRYLALLAERAGPEAVQEGPWEDGARPARLPPDRILRRDLGVHAGSAARAGRFPGTSGTLLLSPGAATRLLHSGGKEAPEAHVRDPRRPTPRRRAGANQRRALRGVLARAAGSPRDPAPGPQRLEGPSSAV